MDLHSWKGKELLLPYLFLYRSIFLFFLLKPSGTRLNKESSWTILGLIMENWIGCFLFMKGFLSFRKAIYRNLTNMKKTLQGCVCWSQKSNRLWWYKFSINLWFGGKFQTLPLYIKDYIWIHLMIENFFSIRRYMFLSLEWSTQRCSEAAAHHMLRKRKKVLISEISNFHLL